VGLLAVELEEITGVPDPLHVGVVTVRRFFHHVEFPAVGRRAVGESGRLSEQRVVQWQRGVPGGRGETRGFPDFFGQQELLGSNARPEIPESGIPEGGAALDPEVSRHEGTRGIVVDGRMEREKLAPENRVAGSKLVLVVVRSLAIVKDDGDVRGVALHGGGAGLGEAERGGSGEGCGVEGAHRGSAEAVGQFIGGIRREGLGGVQVVGVEGAVGERPAVSAHDFSLQRGEIRLHLVAPRIHQGDPRRDAERAQASHDHADHEDAAALGRARSGSMGGGGVHDAIWNHRLGNMGSATRNEDLPAMCS